MSKDIKKFPDIPVYPQAPSTYKIIEPYVDFVADLEAEKVRHEVMTGDLTQRSQFTHRSQTTPSKTRKQNINAPSSRPNTNKSPRNIKTAPASTESQMVRDSLLSAPKKYSQPNVQLDASMKTPFEKAVESLAAMKLHDYALKRKERLRNRYKLWDEIRGTQREMEISGAEQAIIEFSEQLAAWKIKYYVDLYRKKVEFGNRDEDKKNLLKQLKLQKKRIQVLQKEHADYLALKYEEKCHELERNKDALEAVLGDERNVIRQLKEEIIKLNEEKWNLETDMKRLMQEHEKHIEEKLHLIECGKDELAYSKEELEISRRTAQDYCKMVHDLEAQLVEASEKYEQRVQYCESQHDPKSDGQLERKIEGLTKDVFQLNTQLDLLTEVNGELQREGTTLRNTINNLNRELTAARNEKIDADEQVISIKGELFNKDQQITSLEKLITEITVQRDQLRQMADEGTNTTVMINGDLQKLQMTIDQKNKEIQSYQRNEVERSKLLATIDSRLDRLRLDADRSGLCLEDQLVQNVRLYEALQQTNGYSQILEAEINGYRKREILSQRGQTITSPYTAPIGGRSLSPVSQFHSSQSAAPELNLQTSFSIKDDPLIDESLTETLRTVPLPLEGKLVSLLSLLEDKLNQLDSVVRQVDIQGSSQFSENSNESQLEDACRKLEHLLFEETNKLNDLKAELTTARDMIKVAQAEKEKLVQAIKTLPADKSHKRSTLVSHVEKIQVALQERLVDAQNVATEALNCKLECDRLREELSAAEDALDEIRKQRINSGRPISRSRPRQVNRSIDGKRASRERSIQEDSNDDSGFMTPNGGDSSLTESILGSAREGSVIQQEESQPSLPTRPKTKKQFSELNSDSFGFQSPLQLGRKVSAPITPKTIGDSEVYQVDGEQGDHEFDYQHDGNEDGNEALPQPKSRPVENHEEEEVEEEKPTLAKSKHGSNQSLGPKSGISVHSNNSSNQSYFSHKKLELAPSDKSLSKVESPMELLRMIESKLHMTHEVLAKLQARKEQSRADIERWTLFFLKEYGRVPGLAESKYGPSNQIFETFNKIQHEIYSCHYEVQEMFDHLDSRRQEILHYNPALQKTVDQLDELFLDPLLSQHEGEEYEDAYKLHFESVEALLLQIHTDSEEMSIHSNLSLTSGGGAIFPSGIMNYDELDDISKVDVLQNIENDIKEFQQDLDDLNQALRESREVAESLNNKLKGYKKEIQKWYRSFTELHNGVEPTNEDKEREVADLYGVCHETHSQLEDELEKMKTYALISAAKSTEIERLKVIFRKFLRISSLSVTSQFKNSKAAQPVLTAQDSSASMQSSQSLFHSLSDRLGSITEEKKDCKSSTQHAPPKQTPSLDSESINSSTFPAYSENPQQDIVKLTDDLEMLNSYFTAADHDLKELKERKTEIKQLMKSWEEEFIQTNLRKPTSQERKTLMEDMCEEYQAIQEEIAEILEQREKGLKMKVKLEYLLEMRMKQVAS